MSVLPRQKKPIKIAPSLWEHRKTEHEKAEKIREQLLTKDLYTDQESMSGYLNDNLQAIQWPRETLINFEMEDEGRVIFLDVDLPEIEMMPNKRANAPQRGYRLTVTELSEAAVRKLYMEHIHSLGFRIIGESFAALPIAKRVVLSGYSQRPDKTTGTIEDQYLYSLAVTRDQWQEMNFNNLSDLDPVAAFERFTLERNMTKGGVFKLIKKLVE